MATIGAAFGPRTRTITCAWPVRFDESVRDRDQRVRADAERARADAAPVAEHAVAARAPVDARAHVAVLGIVGGGAERQRQVVGEDDLVVGRREIATTGGRPTLTVTCACALAPLGSVMVAVRVCVPGVSEVTRTEAPTPSARRGSSSSDLAREVAALRVGRGARQRHRRRRRELRAVEGRGDRTVGGVLRLRVTISCGLPDDASRLL
jgi:hypothetical protein